MSIASRKEATFKDVQTVMSKKNLNNHSIHSALVSVYSKLEGRTSPLFFLENQIPVSASKETVQMKEKLPNLR